MQNLGYLNCLSTLLGCYVAARVLATYFIPGCVGRGVRLGSENSSAGGAAAGGVWKSGGHFSGKKKGACGNVVSRSGLPKNPKTENSQNQKSVLPKMSARFFYAGKRRPHPIWGLPGSFFAWAGKIQKLPKFCLFSLVGQWALFTRFGPFLWRMGTISVASASFASIIYWHLPLPPSPLFLSS